MWRRVIAFLEAGACALLSIGILLWITLRRFGDVLLTLVPLLLAGVVTLEICVLIDLPLNFANIIALPLLLVGPGTEIVAVTLFDLWQNGQVTELAAMGILWVALMLVVSTCFHFTATAIRSALDAP